MKVLEYPTREVLRLFSSLTPEIFTVNLVTIEDSVRQGPYTTYLDNLLGKVDHAVTGSLDMAGILSLGADIEEGVKKYNMETGGRV